MKKPLALISILFPILLPILAAAQSQERVKDEMGLTRMKVIYPEPGSEIWEGTPVIAVDLASLETPVDKATVVVLFNGADVTDSADITPSYIMYRVRKNLPPGRHEVRVTAKDVNKKDIEPLSWTFRIKGDEPVEEAAAPAGERDNTTGKLVVSTDYVSSNFTPLSTLDVSQLFQEKEGAKLNMDLNFTNASEGRTIIAAYHRETQPYTDVELDKARVNYYDSNFTASLGHFRLELSDLTVIGTELAGVEIDKKYDNWTLNLFSGRTQDPSTSGTFKQLTTGLRTTYDWRREEHTSSFTILHARERNDMYYMQNATPSTDIIASLRHKYRPREDTVLAVEYAGNARDTKLARNFHDSAFQFDASTVRGPLNAEASYFNIGENFLPIAEGSAKFLRSNREGFRGKGSYRATEWLTGGGEYERYDRADAGALTETTTKRGNAYVTVSAGDILPRLTYRKAKLTTTKGTVSESDSVMATILFPSSNNFAETRVSAGWQDIAYSAPGVLTNTGVWTFSLGTSYKDILGISSSYSKSELEDTINNSSTDNKNLSFGLNWNIIPFKLNWNGRYELLRNTGSSVDNEETRFKSLLRYVSDETYTYTLGWDIIDYSDAANPFYDYGQNILRTGVEWSF